MAKRNKPSIAIVGAGTLARALAPSLREAGYRVREVVSRDGKGARARAAAVARGSGARAATLRGAKRGAGGGWLCVSDSGIAEVAGEIARRRDWKGKVALHSSGALGSDELN